MLALLVFTLVAADPAPWAEQEAAHLKNIKQLTTDFVRAGEGYFSPDGKTIIFQAEEKSTGNPFYQIFTMDLASGRLHRVSPGVGKTTCSYFSPDGKKVIFASSHLDPDAKKKYQDEYKLREEDRKQGRRRNYKWDFDGNMDIFEANPDGSELKRLTESKGYNAEGSFSPDGKQIVFCSNRSGEANLELIHHGPGWQECPATDQIAGLLQRRPVFLARWQKSDFPQRSQKEGSPPTVRDQHRWHRRKGTHR